MLQGIDVLVVDDAPEVLFLLGRMLRASGASVRLCESAEDAYAAFVDARPDVILSDISMPEEDGYSLIGRIRARERENSTPYVPAAAVTTHSDRSDVARALTAGFDAHLAKPVSCEGLLGLVAGMVGRLATAP